MLALAGGRRAPGQEAAAALRVQLHARGNALGARAAAATTAAVLLLLLLLYPVLLRPRRRRKHRRSCSRAAVSLRLLCLARCTVGLPLPVALALPCLPLAREPLLLPLLR